MSEEKSPKEFAAAIDRAIVVCEKFVPVRERQPVLGGGPVLTGALAILVAARAVLEAVIEIEEAVGKTSGTST